MNPIEYNSQRLLQGLLRGEHIHALVRYFQERTGLVVDGKCGPTTTEAIERYIRSLRDTAVIRSDPGEPPSQSEDPLSWVDKQEPMVPVHCPTTRAEVYSTFGNPGIGKADKKWAKENIVTVRDLPGVPSKWYFQVNKKIEPIMREAFRRAHEASTYDIERAGCYVFRHIRHDSSRPLSLHSWGIAVDIDPAHNAARTFAKGHAPVPFSKEWHKIWPQGIDRGFVEAFESVGFLWGGAWGIPNGDLDRRIKSVSFVDPMHFQFALC